LIVQVSTVCAALVARAAPAALEAADAVLCTQMLEQLLP
jgi:hypothetical protein